MPRSRPEPPAPRREAAAAGAALDALRAAVRRHHYDTVLRLHGWETAPRCLDASLRQTLDRAPAPARDLLRLLWAGARLPAATVDELFGSAGAAALREAGLLVASPDGLAARYRLETVGDQLLLVEWPAARAAGVYFGEDSQFLRAVLQPRRGDACLDLCTGSGVQALRCATLAAEVDAVDLSPAAVRLARLNARLNELADRVTVYEGDLWDPLPSERRWDHVACNPPLVPVPEAVPYPLCGHGGADGLDVVRRVLAELPRRLRPGGRATIIGACTGSEDEPALCAELRRGVAGDLGATVFLLLRAPLRDWVQMLTDTVAAIYPEARRGQTVLRCRRRYGPAFDRTFVYTFLVSAEAGAAGCRVFDYSTVDPHSYWFVNRRMVR